MPKLFFIFLNFLNEYRINTVCLHLNDDSITALAIRSVRARTWFNMLITHTLLPANHSLVPLVIEVEMMGVRVWYVFFILVVWREVDTNGTVSSHAFDVRPCTLLARYVEVRVC